MKSQCNGYVIGDSMKPGCTCTHKQATGGERVLKEMKNTSENVALEAPEAGWEKHRPTRFSGEPWKEEMQSTSI